MIARGKKFEADIKQLKKLSADRKKNSGKYGAAYSASRIELAEKYEVSIRTVERWLKDRSPWVRRKRDDAGKERAKVSPKVRRLISDGLASGLNKKQTKEIVIKKSGKNISDRVFDREANKEPEFNEDTVYASEAKKYFRKLFEYDLIPPDKGLKMKYKDTNFTVSKPDLDDICRILANAYYRASGEKSDVNINRAALRRAKLWQLFDEAVFMITERGVSVNELREVSMFIQRLEIDRNKVNPRVTTLWKMIQSYKPDVTLDEVISLAEELEGVYD